MSIFNLFKKGEKLSEIQASPVQSIAPQNTHQEQSSPSETSNESCSEVKHIHNLIILDESGSMQSIYRPALTGVNETLQTIRNAQMDHEEQNHSVSLIAFDSGHYNRIYNNIPSEKAVDITKDQYRPEGCTPLYDAMGRSINELRPHVNAGDVVLVTVITDGYENASREYNGKAIKSLVEEMKNQGWVFTYIGANQDVEAVAASMSIDNHLAFDADDESTGAMFAKECRSRKKFFGKLSQKIPMADLGAGYFDENDDDNKF